MNETTLIVGACQAGVQVASSLREGGYAGRIILVGEEPHYPYQRPPLSKSFLLRKTSLSSLTLRAPAYFTENSIELVGSEHVIHVDRRDKCATCASGQRYAFDRLVLATGSRAKTLTGFSVDSSNVLTLRSIEDAERLSKQLATAENVVIVGGGFIGLECAVVASGMGKKVTLLEAADRLLSRSVAPIVSAFFADALRKRRVDIRLNARMACVKSQQGAVRSVVLADGSSIDADLFLIAVGGSPCDELGAVLELECENGILVNALGQTSISHIYAAGDCAAHRSLSGRNAVRLESVQNAIDQAKCVAASILGRPAPYDSVPWFWSDQGNLKLQIAGLSFDYDQAILRGDTESGSFSVLYFKQGNLLAVDSINRPADHIAARRLIAARKALPMREAADVSIPLKAYL